MSAPFVSGSLMLLESAWPILKTNGTAANLLLATATDLGQKGVDATYGNGIVNLGNAFFPYGALSVMQAEGKSMAAVTNLTGSLISSGTLGSLSSIQSKLSNYTSFDAYSRNFSVNLSGLIRSPASAATINPLPTNTNSGPMIMKFADGSEIATIQTPSSPSLTDKLGGFGYNSQGYQNRRMAYVMLTDKAGTTTAIGYGYPLHFSYAKALYGNDDFAWQSGELGVSGLSGLAQGGGMLVHGMNLNEDTRIAFSWSGTSPYEPEESRTPLEWNSPWTNPSASSIGIGLSHKFNQTFTGGLMIGTLNEKHGFLGSTYDASSLVSLGDENKSFSYGFSAAVNFDRTTSFLFETTYATSRGASGNGLLAGTSNVFSRSYGVTLMSRNLLKESDKLMISAKQPLSVVSGQAAIIMPSIDEQGIAHFNMEWTSIVSDGREMDYKLSYDTPLRKNQALSFAAGYRKDIQNIAGSNEASLGMAWSMRF